MMRFHGLDLNLLVVLDALLSERSITATADRLNRTQPAISASLRRLRDYFGDELFVMNGREFNPTPLALTLGDPIRQALGQIQEAVIGKSGFDPTEATRAFKIMMSDYVAQTFFKDIARVISDEAPGIRFELVQFDDDVAAPMDRGEIDFLIFPEVYLDSKHPSRPLYTEELVAVRCATSASSEITMGGYFSGRHVAAKFGKTRVPSIEEFLMMKVGLHREIAVVVPNFTLIPHFLVGTDRIGTMHRRLAEEFAKTMPLRIDPLPFELPPYTQALQWPQLNDNDPASIWLREKLTSAITARTSL